MSSTRGQKLFAIEVAKFAAAFGVAVIHLAPATPEALLITDVGFLFPVYFFYASAIHFTVRRALEGGGGVLAHLRVERILLPYFVWTAVYLVLRLASNPHAFDGMGTSEWVEVIFLGGAAVHLYFLPQLVYFQIVALAAVGMVAGLIGGRRPWSEFWWLAGALAAGNWLHQFWNYSWLMALVYCVLGTVSYVAVSCQGRRRFAIVIAATALMLLLASVTAAQMNFGPVLVFLRGPLFGCAALVVLSHIEMAPLSRWQMSVISCYFGVYLCHHAIEEGAELLMRRLGHDLVPYDVFSRLFVAAVVVTAGVLFTLLVRRNSVLAWGLLGERPLLPVVAKRSPGLTSDELRCG